jgi:hypothetical protein
MTEKQRKAFEKLGIKADEIAEIEATDKEIDRGAKLFELPDDLKAGAKKARQADRKPAERKPREKKADADKAFLLWVMLKALETHDDPGFGTEFYSEVTNPEREFSFMYNGKKYKVVMSCPRS